MAKSKSKKLERRIFHRSPIELAASYGITNDDVSQAATVVNISQTGFCISSPRKVAPGRNLKLNVEIEDNDFVTVEVETMWAKKVGDTGDYQIGVRITKEKGKDFDRFLDFYVDQVKQVSGEFTN